MKTIRPKIRPLVAGLLVTAIFTACNPANTPTPASPPTEIPQSIKTPIPIRVTNFSEPLLLAIQDRSPDFQDDFSQNLDQWRFDVTPDQGSGKMEIANGVLTMSVEPGQLGILANNGYEFKNFILQVDVYFQPLPLNEFQISWGQVDEIHENRVFSIGDISGWRLMECGSYDCTVFTSGPVPVSLSDPVTIMIVSKGTEFEIYLNGIPLTYYNNIEGPAAPGIGIYLWSGESSANSEISLDNLSIWDLDPVFSPPTATPEPTAIPTSAPWIADFGTPILLAIQDRAPDFQDDFSQGSSGWITSRGGIVDISNGVLALSGRVAQGVEYVIVPRANFINFVVKVELNARKLISGCEAAIQWRGGADGPGRIFGLENGEWSFYSIYQSQDDLPFAAGMPTNGPLPLSASGIYSITLISREPEIAVYLNGEPITYVMDIVRPPDPGFQFSLWHPDFCTAEYDNLKVWDLDKLK